VISKCLEVRDSMTFIPVLATNTAPDGEGQRFLLRTAGYASDGRTIILTKLNDCSGACDPYEWPSSRTMTVAHMFIQKHFDELKDGDVVDVEFILGETEAPKVSESES
jgi:hypothetical protein